MPDVAEAPALSPHDVGLMLGPAIAKLSIAAANKIRIVPIPAIIFVRADCALTLHVF